MYGELLKAQPRIFTSVLQRQNRIKVRSISSLNIPESRDLLIIVMRLCALVNVSQFRCMIRTHPCKQVIRSIHAAIGACSSFLFFFFFAAEPDSTIIQINHPSETSSAATSNSIPVSTAFIVQVFAYLSRIAALFVFASYCCSLLSLAGNIASM